MDRDIGSGAEIRTLIDGVRDRSPTIGRLPNNLAEGVGLEPNTLAGAHGLANRLRPTTNSPSKFHTFKSIGD